MELSERKKKILRVVIENYIQKAEPVGSKTIVEQADLGVSSATVRNELAELESMNLLEQPHTSAGRIPTPAGYRFYVNELMDEHRLTMQETQRIQEALQIKMEELDRVIDQAGKIVSRLTQYPSFAIASGNRNVTISRFDLIMVDTNAFIVVILTDSNDVRNKLLRLPTQIDTSQLEIVNSLLNSTFVGKTLEEITPELMQIVSHAAGDLYGLISVVVSFTIDVLEELNSQSFHTAGVSTLFNQPEYQDLDRAQPLINYLSQERDPGKFPVPKDDSTRIIIGPENAVAELKDSSVVMASYDIGEGLRGVIGVVGPIRMDYAKITARMTYFAESLSRMFGKDEFIKEKNIKKEEKEE